MSGLGEIVKPLLGNNAVERELHERVALAYATALRHAHEGGSIQIHAGADVVEYLKSLVEHPRHPLLNNLVQPHLGGQPIIPASEHLGADHLSVHVVHHIF